MKPLLAALAAALVVPLLAASDLATASPVPQPDRAAAVQRATTDPNPSNPLRGRWGVYRGGMDQVWAPYQRSRGETRRLLGKIMNQPRAKWLGAWIPDRDIEAKVRGYIANANGGDPDVLVTMAVFRMVPWEDEACRRVSTRAERQSYVRWIRAFVRGVGRSRTAIILQPDGPFAQCAPRGSLAHSNLLRWTSRQLAALPRSAVYLEGGNADWNHYDPDLAADLLQAGGVQYVRGFHFNTTHYESTAAQIRFGVQVVRELAGRGIRHRHFTIDTGSNGRPFTWAWLKAHRAGCGLRQRPDLPRPDPDPLRHPRHPAHRRRRQPSVGPFQPGPGARPAPRRRLPVGRQALAQHAGGAVQHDAGPRGGAHHAVPVTGR